MVPQRNLCVLVLLVTASHIASSQDQTKKQNGNYQTNWEQNDTSEETDVNSTPSVESQLSYPPLQSNTNGAGKNGQLGQISFSDNGQLQIQYEASGQRPSFSQQNNSPNRPSFQMTAGGSEAQSADKIHLFDPLGPPHRKPQRLGPPGPPPHAGPPPHEGPRHHGGPKPHGGPRHYGGPRPHGGPRHHGGPPPHPQGPPPHPQGPPPHGGFDPTFGGPGSHHGPPQPFRAAMGGPMSSGFMQSAGSYLSPNNWMSGPQGIAGGVIPSLMFMASPGILIPSPPMLVQPHGFHGQGLQFQGQGPQFQQNEMYGGYNPMQGGQQSQYTFQRPASMNGVGNKRPKRPQKNKPPKKSIEDSISATGKDYEKSSSNKPGSNYIIHSNGGKEGTNGSIPQINITGAENTNENATISPEEPKKLESTAAVDMNAPLPSNDSKVVTISPEIKSNQTADSVVFSVDSKGSGNGSSGATERDGLADNIDLTLKEDISNQKAPSGQGSLTSSVNIAAIPAGGAGNALNMARPQGYDQSGSGAGITIQSNSGGKSSNGGEKGGLSFGLGGSGGQSGFGGGIGGGQSTGVGTGGLSFGGSEGKSVGEGVGGLSIGGEKAGGQSQGDELRADLVGGEGKGGSGAQMQVGGGMGGSSFGGSQSGIGGEVINGKGNAMEGFQVGGGGQSQTGGGGGSNIKLVTTPSIKKSPTIKLQTIGAPAMSNNNQLSGSFLQGGNSNNIRLITVPAQGKTVEGSFQQGGVGGGQSSLQSNGEGGSSRQIIMQNGDGRYATGGASMMDFLAKHPGLGEHQNARLSRYEMMYPNSFLVTPIKTKLQRPGSMMDGNFLMEDLAGQTTGANGRKLTGIKGDKINDMASDENGKFRK